MNQHIVFLSSFNNYTKKLICEYEWTLWRISRQWTISSGQSCRELVQEEFWKLTNFVAAIFFQIEHLWNMCTSIHLLNPATTTIRQLWAVQKYGSNLSRFILTIWGIGAIWNCWVKGLSNTTVHTYFTTWHITISLTWFSFFSSFLTVYLSFKSSLQFSPF